MRVVGRFFAPEGGELGQITVRRGARGKRISADATGIFRLDVPDQAGPLDLVIERDGQVISRQSLDLRAIGGDLILQVPPRPIPDGGLLPIDTFIAERLFDRTLGDLRQRARDAGLAEVRVGELERMVDELEDLSLQAMPALGGDRGALAAIRASLAGERPFDFRLDLSRFKPYPGDFGIDPCRALPSSPWTLVQAGMLLDGGEGTVWAGRAVTAILRRAEPAARVARALSGMELGQVGAPVLSEALEFAGRAAAAGAGTPVWEALGGPGSSPVIGEIIGGIGGAIRPLPGGIGGGLRPLPGGIGGLRPLPGPGFEIPRRPGLATLLDPCNLEWLECAHSFVAAKPVPNPKPPRVDRVEPLDILANTPTKITLHSVAGEGFGATKDPSWSISLDGTALAIDSWADDKIVLSVPATAPACRDLHWVVDQYEASRFLNEQSAACGRFLGDRPIIAPFITYPIDNLSVVGDPEITLFAANGTSGALVNAEGCTKVPIEWSVDALVCSGSTAIFEVTLTDDTGAVLYQGPQARGQVEITEQQDRTYTLTTKNTLNGASAGQTIKVMTVDRYQRVTSVSVTAPSGPLKTGAQATIKVTLSCPADDPVNVVVTSSHPDRFPSLTIPVAVGQSEVTAQANAGARTGRVTLSAAVPGFQGAPATTALLVHNPRYERLVGSSVEQCDGGSVTVRVSGAAGVGMVAIVTPAGNIVGTNPRANASVPSDPASGTIDASASFGATPPGSYNLIIVADGITLQGGPITVSLAPPSVSLTVSPSSVQVCGSTQVTLTATARRADDLIITRSDGSMVGQLTPSPGPCASFTATATTTLSDAASFRAVARRANAPNATSTASVLPRSDVPTFSGGRFYNPNPPGSPTYYLYALVIQGGFVTSTVRVGAMPPRPDDRNPPPVISFTPTRCVLYQLVSGVTDDGPTLINDWTWKLPLNNQALLGHPSGSHLGDMAATSSS